VFSFHYLLGILVVMDIPIIYEDESILAVNKPVGIVVHSDGKSDDMTLADWILEKYPDMRDVGEPLVLGDGTKIIRPGIVHRLDKETSGVLVIAKTPEAFAYLKSQFQERNVEKTYRAFVYGRVKNDTGVIDKPIGKSRSDFRKWSAEYGARGELRDAVTEYRVLKRGDEATYLEAYPKTGRTHQLRVHLKAIGHPVVCDALYASGKKCLFGFARHALHANTLTLTLSSGARLKLEAPLPEDFLLAEDLIHKV